MHKLRVLDSHGAVVPRGNTCSPEGEFALLYRWHLGLLTDCMSIRLALHVIHTT